MEYCYGCVKATAKIIYILLYMSELKANIIRNDTIALPLKTKAKTMAKIYKTVSKVINILVCKSESNFVPIG